MNAVIANCLSFVALAFYVLLSIRPVTVDVSPRVAMAPASVLVTVHIAPNAENRGLYVEADGQEYRSSFIQLEGENAPIFHSITWQRLEAGEYAIRASVGNSVGQVIASDRTTLTVK